MKKEYFIKQKELIKQQMESLNGRRKELELQYIEANKNFEIGDMVRNKTSNEYGFVYDYDIDYQDNVREKARKEKKDGAPSLHNLYIYKSTDLELANKTKD